MEEIDRIDIKRKLAEVAEDYRRKQMDCERLANSKDATVSAHKDYWMRLAGRHSEQAKLVDELWQSLP